MAKVPVTDRPAGPALDAAAAEVLGHIIVYRHDLEEWFIASDGMAFQEGMRSGMFFETTGGLGPIEKRYCLEMPKYSSRIAAAWELVEFASVPEPGETFDGIPTTALRFGFRISRALKEDTGSLDDEWGYAAAFMPQELILDYRAWAPTAPLAITRAFLLAHGVTEVEVADD